MKHMTHDKIQPSRGPAVCSLIALTLAALTSAAWATEPIAIQPPPRESGWSYSLAPYFWGVRLDGELTVDGINNNVKISDKELLKHMKLGLMLAAEVRKDRVGVFGDIVVA